MTIFEQNLVLPATVFPKRKSINFEESKAEQPKQIMKRILNNHAFW